MQYIFVSLSSLPPLYICINNLSFQKTHIPPKRRITQDLHGATSQKTTFFTHSWLCNAKGLFQLSGIHECSPDTAHWLG
jgi:hypothetical protein